MKQKRSLNDFCKEYVARLSRFFLSRGIPTQDVDDLVEESFVVLLSKRSRIRNGKSRAFLFGIANRILMAYRRKTLLDRLRRDNGGSATIDDRAEPTLSADAVAAQRERADALEKVVSQLPSRMQEVIRLVYFEGRSRAEAARIMRIARSTLYESEKGAIKRLKSNLEERI